MSGADIPYQLRPSKFIDRQMFMECLARLIVSRGPEKYVYISMGGRHLVDHHAVYNRLGLQALYSFDRDRNEVARQRFNRPMGAAICEELDSGNLPAELDQILDRFPGKKNLIVWLDYTSADRRTQLQEAEQTLARLRHGDIFRITLNASALSLGANDWKKAGAAGPGPYRAEKLRAQIGEYVPTNIETISEDGLADVLAQCVEMTVKSVERLKPSLRFTPVLITTYRDGSRMLTVTCAVSDAVTSDKFPSPLFRRWKFACKGWNDIQSISAPVLSSKEQYRLDAYLHRGPKRMLAALKFLPAKDLSESLETLRSYRRFHRYYPTFRHVED